MFYQVTGTIRREVDEEVVIVEQGEEVLVTDQVPTLTRVCTIVQALTPQDAVLEAEELYHVDDPAEPARWVSGPVVAEMGADYAMRRAGAAPLPGFAPLLA